MIIGEEMQLLQTCEWDRGGRQVFNVAKMRQGERLLRIWLVPVLALSSLNNNSNDSWNPATILWTVSESRGISVQDAVSVFRSGGLHSRERERDDIQPSKVSAYQRINVNQLRNYRKTILILHRTLRAAHLSLSLPSLSLASENP
jgi:hypothetical protein